MQPKWKQLFQLIKATRPPKLIFTTALFLSLLTTMAGLAIPLLASRLIDNFDLENLNHTVIIGMATAFFIQAIAGGVSVYFLAKVGQHIIASLREQLWSKLLHLPVPYYDEHETGDAVSRMTNDTGIIKNLITEHFTGFVTGIISVAGAIIILFYLDWPLTLVMFSIIPIALLFLIPIGRRMASISRNLQAETAGFSANLTRVISEIRLVKASNAEHKEWNKGKSGIQKLYRLGLREGIIQALLSPLVSSMIIIVLVLIIGFGGIRVSSGAMTAGELAAFFIYLFQIIMPITQIVTFATQYQKTVGATEKVLSILDLESEDLENGDPIPANDKDLIVENVSFAYTDEETILKDVSFTAEKGDVTAIVGPSGSGKTTMFSLFEQFYYPQEGRILYGSAPIHHYPLESWRRMLGYVSQESPIYSGTIKDNLTYGLEEEPSMDDIRSAAKMAYADAFIEELTHGYDTEVGERGIKLSGGQRQRVAIARALLRNPNVLMLDEATSSLDSQSETVVQQALKNLMNGRTTLVIAHRLSTIVDADKIIFLEKGKVTGTGTHEELYQTHTLYKDFARQQLKIRE